MAPGTRRANRGGYAEHDDFEGLPVRQWRREVVNLSTPSPQEKQKAGDIWAIDCIHGVPRDLNLLPMHSQELLRAARSGHLNKRPLPAEEEEPDPDVLLAEKPEKKEEFTAKGFPVKVWRQVPRSAELEISHLAKRRKNTTTIASKTPEEKVQGSSVTRATVRRIDAAGNPYTEEMTLTDGQKVDGEIISTRVEAAVPTTGEEPAIVAPPRRRPPPPKRKSKAGPGRGKKKNQNEPSERPQLAQTASAENGEAHASKTLTEEENAIKQETGEAPHRDREIVDGDGDGDGEGDEEDDDDDESGEDGEEGDEGEPRKSGESDRAEEAPRHRHEDKDQPMADSPVSVNPAVSQGSGAEVKHEPALQESIPTNPVLFAPPVGSLAAGSPKLEGSPLKHVVVPPSPEPLTSQSNEKATSHACRSPEQQKSPEQVTQTTEIETRSESMVAEPPSTIVGEVPQQAAEWDLPGQMALQSKSSSDETLFPPPPEQVGNISTPKNEDDSRKTSEDGTSEGYQDKPREDTTRDESSMSEKPPLHHQDSIMTEDSIRPDDSASANFPLTESGAPSETGAVPGVTTKEAASAPTADPVIEDPIHFTSPSQEGSFQTMSAGELGPNLSGLPSRDSDLEGATPVHASKEQLRHVKIPEPTEAIGPAVEDKAVFNAAEKLKHVYTGALQVEAAPTEAGPAEAERVETQSLKAAPAGPESVAPEPVGVELSQAGSATEDKLEEINSGL